MIFKSFLLGNLVCLYMKILNSVVVIGLYYGFLTTFSIGISSLFFLQAGVIEEREEGIENKISVTTGFITGQLMIFISIIYAPMYLALSRPHTITILVVPYLLFHFFWNNQKNFLDYRSTKNSIRNLTIQWIFLNNLIFQLFNYFILPSSILARLINIYMFRCNNKILFITSSFFGWLIGQILFMKWIGLVLVWIQQNNFIRSNRYIRFNKYLVSELRNWIARIFSILLFITCIYYLGRIPSPSLTKKLKQISKKEEISENGEETDREKKRTSIFKDTSYSFFSEEKGGLDKIDETEEIRVNINSKEKTKEKLHVKASWYKNKPVLKTSYVNENKNPKLNLEILKKKTYKRSLWFEQPFVILIFDYKQWNRPLRYIKNNRFENAIRNEMSQYFFYTCQNDGKLKISFTYPPSLLTFFEMIQRRISLYTIEKVSSNELYNYWIYTNEQKKNKQSKEFINRIEALDKGYLFWNIVEKRTRLYTEIKTKEYLPKIYDPFVNGPFRGTIKKRSLPSIINKMFIENSKENEMGYINKIHDIFLTNSQEFEHKIDNIFDQKLLSKGIVYFLTLINQLNKESIWNFNLKGLYLFIEQEKRNSKDVSKFLKFVFDLIITDPNNHKRIINKSVGVKTISKKVPQRSYKLINELEQQEGENEGSIDHQIRSRKAKRIILFGRQKTTNPKDINYPDQTDEIALIRYSQQPDFRRDIIKGSMRNQRRKTVIWKLFQANLNSPLFFDRIDKFSFFYFEISKRIKFIFRNKVSINSKFQISSYTEKERKEMKKNKDNKREEKVRIEIAEAWDAIPLAQIIRGYMLITQSILRKYILLPSLIIVKNIGRLLLFQFPEWSEDLKEWNREVYIKCTYNGVPLSETEFPKNWLMEGIQIKILFPFCLKPWHRSKFSSHHRDPIITKKQKDDFCFLTIWGMETELPFGSPRKGPSFFEPIFKKLEKKVQKLKNKCSLILRVLNEKIKFFLRISKELKSGFIKNILFLKRRIINLVKLNPIFRLKEVYESNQPKKEKDSISNNQIIYNSSIKNGFMNWTKYSLTEKKMKELSDRTNKIRNQIEIITKDKKRIFITSKIKTNQSYNTKRGVESSKNFWNIVKRINARLIRKLHYFIKDFIEKIYINIYLCIINIPTLNAQLFIESTKRMIDKYIYNNQSNQERIDKRNQTTIRFISTLTKSIYNISNSNKSSQIFYDLSYLSQTYVFYKLSQIQVNNLDKLKCVFQYHGTSFFVKNKIKNYLGLQGIFYSNSKLKYKKVWKSKTKQWKNWLLRSHYQYNLSTIKWSRLVSQKWRNRIKQRCTFQNKNLNKWDFHNKDQLIHYKKQKDYEGISLSKKKDNFKKHYRYDLLSYKSINFEYRNDSDIYRSPLQFQVKKKDNIYYNYNTHKGKLLNILESINNYLNNYLVEDGFIGMDKNMNRKFFDYQILYFCLKKKINIEDSININIKSNKNIKNESIIDKITNKNNKNLVYLKIHQKRDLSNQTKSFFNWMGMNEEIRNHYRFNIGLWFFSEFILLSNEYKIQPWIIPIQLLLLNFNENVKENINRKPKKNLFISSNAKKSFELENKNQEEKELSGRGNLGSDVYKQENLEALLSNDQKDLKKDSTKSNMKKLTQKNQYKSNTEEELNFFLKSYLLFQLRWNDPLNEKMINNIKSYCLLLRMINPKEITLVSIQKGEMNLDIMLTPKDLTLTELIKKGILIIEPVRLSVKNDSQFLMYQTVTISLVHKSKHQMNQRYQQKRYVEKQKMKNSILRDYKMFENKNENYSNFHLLIPETILSPRCRREFKIRIYFDSKSRNNMDRNPIFTKKKNVKKCDYSLDENKYLDKNKSIKLKFFLWPNFRLEDLTCMNRYWFNTNNGTRLTVLRIHMYPQIKIR